MSENVTTAPPGDGSPTGESEQQRRDDGWIRGALSGASRAYMDYLSIWSTTNWFHRRVSAEGQQVSVRQDNWRHDSALALASIVPVLAYVWLMPQSPTEGWSWSESLVAGVCAWWCVDRSISSLLAAAFGFKSDPKKKEPLTVPRAQRRMLLKLCLYYPSLVFAYAVVLWWMATHGFSFAGNPVDPSAMLQLAFSTMTTIGYGTYAPDDTPTILVCMLAAATALLNLGASLSVLTGIVKQDMDASVSGKASDTDQESSQTKPIGNTEYRVRMFTPWICTLLLIGLATAVAHEVRPRPLQHAERYRVIEPDALPDLSKDGWEPVLSLPKDASLVIRRR